MEAMNQLGVSKTEDRIELPPGFRFHPTDEELITHYLSKKVVDGDFTAIAIGEVDMNKVEPWELPWRAKIGEKEWYFFCVRDKKYPTGLRTNRATASGYWKATGKDKEIFRGKTLVGMKKTLVFYRGRAPKGEKTNWVSHEYRLEGTIAVQNLPKSAKNDWVISRVFHKTNGGKKVHISGLTRTNELITRSPLLPPLMDPSPSHVHCFSSNAVTSPPKFQGDYSIINSNNLNSNNNNAIMFAPSSNALDPSLSSSSLYSFPWAQFNSSPIQGLLQLPGSVSPLQDPTGVLRSFVGNYNQGLAREVQQQMASASQENTVASTENSSGVVSNIYVGKKHFEEQGASHDMDSIWNYCK